MESRDLTGLLEERVGIKELQRGVHRRIADERRRLQGGSAVERKHSSCYALRADEDSVLCCGDDATRKTTENRRSTLCTVM